MTTSVSHRDGGIGGPVGLVGVGDMGAGIGHSLLRAHWDVVAYDIRPAVIDPLVELGAIRAVSLDEVGKMAAVIAVVVVDDEQVRTVVRTLLPCVRPGTVIMVNSTVLPSTVIGLAEEARAAGADLVDAGVAGGAEKSHLGTLTVMLGGADDSVKAVWPIVEAFAEHQFHLGPVGAGVAAKLVNNTLTIAGYALILEAMKLGAAYGLDEDKLTEVVTLSGGDSRTIRTWGRQDRLRRDRAHYDPKVLYDFMSKDVREAAVAGGERQLILPLIATAGMLLPRLLQERDALLAGRPVEDVPVCAVCEQELSISYRSRGVHPECVFWADADARSAGSPPT